MIPQPDSPLEVNLRFFFLPQFAAKNHPSLFGQIMSWSMALKRNTKCWLTSEILLIVWPHARFVLQEVPEIDCHMMKPGLYITVGNNGNNKSLFQNDAYWILFVLFFLACWSFWLNWHFPLPCQFFFRSGRTNKKHQLKTQWMIRRLQCMYLQIQGPSDNDFARQVVDQVDKWSLATGRWHASK